MAEIKPPRIYFTDLPDKLIDSLSDPSTVFLSAPTGEGKTLMLIDILACHAKNTNHKKKCILVIPTKPAVLAIHKYATHIFDHKIGYRMHDNVISHSKEDITIMVTGYFLEYILHNKSLIHKDYIIAIDEAHDSSLQTDLLVRILSWIKAEKTLNLKLLYPQRHWKPIDTVPFLRIY
jgi:HrpA-like RNA helicase